MVFAIYWHESAMELHVFPLPIPPPATLPSDPSGSSRCTSPEHLSQASNLGWWSVSPLTVYLFQCYSLRTSHPRLLPQSPQSLCNDNLLGLYKGVKSCKKKTVPVLTSFDYLILCSVLLDPGLQSSIPCIWYQLLQVPISHTLQILWNMPLLFFSRLSTSIVWFTEIQSSLLDWLPRGVLGVILRQARLPYKVHVSFAVSATSSSKGRDTVF